MDNSFEPGQRAWHRFFGWGTVERPALSSNGKLLFCSDYKHIKVYTQGKGWVEYRGENGGKIQHIFMPANELFPTEQNDKTQGLAKMLIEIIE